MDGPFFSRPGPVVSSSNASSTSSSSSSSLVNQVGEFEFRGNVTSVTGNAIKVGTRTVTFNSATAFRRITQAQLVVGVLLEVKGTLLSDGSVTAVRVTLED